MRIFINRFDDEYRAILLKRLQLDGEDGLINTSVEIDEPSEKFPKYSKICKIDFSGIAATTLFDRSGYYHKSNSLISLQLYKVLQNLQTLNDNGIKLRIRLLLLYPYSEYAITRIQAESSRKRSSMNERKFIRAFNLVDDINPKVFNQSTLLRHQTYALETVQEYIKEFNLLDPSNPNKISIRFTPYGLNTCKLSINNVSFFDSYTLAKENISDKHLISISPLTMIEKKEDINDKIIFNGYEDHFRYLWELDSTLYCEDATKFDKSTFTGLSDIKEPINVTYDNKAELILAHNLNEYTNLLPDELAEITNNWKFKMGFALRKLTVNLRENPSKEKLFIACSWANDANGKKIPNQYARRLKEWLEIDFGSGKPNPCLNVDYVLTQTGDNVYEKLYQDLQDATLAIILLTKDIESHDKKYYSKPNLSHELGYLIKQLEGTKRVFIFYEEGVELITNVGHISYKTFTDTNFKLRYLDSVIDWLKNSGCYLNKSFINLAETRQSEIISGVKE